MKLLLFIGLTNMIIGANINYYLYNNQKIYLKRIDSNSTKIQKLTSVIFYEKENGELVGLRNQFFIKLKTSNIAKLTKRYELKLINSYSRNLHLVESNNSNILQIINIIHKDKDIIYAYPNFLRKVEQR